MAQCPECLTYGWLMVTENNGYFQIDCPTCGPVRRTWSNEAYDGRDNDPAFH